MSQTLLTVRQLNTYVRSVLEGDVNLVSVYVVGELSNLKNHLSSGHLYFALKDNDALIRSVMFSANAKNLNFTPSDGMKVVCRGRVSIYEKDGQYQFYAESMTPEGAGSLALAFEQVKEKLASEGLFNASHKRSLPSFPGKIAVITSETGAAVQDIFTVLNRRYPLCEILFCPSLVQGALAPKSIIAALETIYIQKDIDLIILGRGGGSAEDLSCFNDEALARTVYRSPIPVISAVGHETDYTICDFVADLRAPTPSAAAELAVPDQAEIYTVLLQQKLSLRNNYLKLIGNYENRLEISKNSWIYKDPSVNMFAPFELRYINAAQALIKNYQLVITHAGKELAMLASQLNALSPLKVLERGYTAVYSNNKLVKSVSKIQTDDCITVRFSDGTAECTVNELHKINREV